MRALTIVQFIFVGLLLTGLLPHVSAGSIACFLILMAAGVVVFREARVLFAPDGGNRTWGAAPHPHMHTRPLTADSFETRSASAPKYVPYEPEREGIEFRSHDSVEQIARMMVTAGFRQASLKYHPDHGGSNDLMSRIVQARTLLLKGIARS